jgi:hypothetical protein
MSSAEVLRRLRLFLRALAAMIFAGTLVELWLVNHNEDAIQWTAFVLAGLGLLLSVMIIARQGPVTVALLRWCALVVIAGSLFGVYQHVYNNVAFEREIQPNATTNRLIWRGLSGPNPLLAPATLAMAGLLLLASAYKQSHTVEPE